MFVPIQSDRIHVPYRPQYQQFNMIDFSVRLTPADATRSDSHVGQIGDSASMYTRLAPIYARAGTPGLSTLLQHIARGAGYYGAQ